LLSIASTLQIKASELDQLTPAEASPDTARALKEMAHLSRQLVAAIRLKADKLRRLD
jgi:hypothetical protein